MLKFTIQISEADAQTVAQFHPNGGKTDVPGDCADMLRRAALAMVQNSIRNSVMRARLDGLVLCVDLQPADDPVATVEAPAADVAIAAPEPE